MKVINRENGREKVLATRQQILLNLLAPVKDEFSLVSNTLAEIVEKYKDKPLVRYVPTLAQELRMIADPEYALDIPKYIVEGFDEAVSNDRFEQKLRDEFYERFERKDTELYNWINENNPTYKIVF